MPFFIDTNIFVAALRGRAPQVQEHIMRLRPEDVLVPHVVLAELRVGAAKSARPEHHDRLVSAILQPFAIVWPDDKALEHYVQIRVDLEKSGRLISEPDLWIAAIARAADGTLVTNNTGEFGRVSNLKLMDWLAA